MIPIRDTVRSRTTPVVTILLIVMNAAVFLYEAQLGRMLNEFLDAFGFVPERFLRWGELGGNPLSPYRFLPIFTAMFLHGGWAHILGNMLYLWIFGDNVEDRFGHGRFLFFYLACGTAAFLVQAFFNPEAGVPAVGASGAIAGVLGAYVLLFPRSRIVTLIPIFIIPWFVEIPAVIYLGVWFVMQLFSGALELSSEAGKAGGIAWWAHIGGFLAGMVLSLVLKRSDRRPSYVDLYGR